MTDETPDAAAAEGPVEVPYATLPAATLQGILDDLVTRDGTDYGAVERTREQKVAALRAQLERGHAALVFDPATETIGLLTREELAHLTSAR